MKRLFSHFLKFSYVGNLLFLGNIALAGLFTEPKMPTVSATSNNFLTAISSSGSVTVAQPSFTNLSGTISSAQVGPYLLLTGGTLTGQLGMSSNKIVSVTDPTAAQDAATKNYVDTQLSYLNPADAVVAASTGTIAGTYTNAVSGVCIGDTFTTTSTVAFSLDGYSPAVGNRVLFKDQVSSFQDGVWTLTTQAVPGVLGSVLTRALDSDTSADFNAGQIIPIINGTVNAGASYYQTANNTTCSSSTQTWTQFQKASSAYFLAAGTLGVGNGGTGQTTLGTTALLIGNATNPIGTLASGSANQVLQSNGAGSLPTWVATIATSILGTIPASSLSGTLAQARYATIDVSAGGTGATAKQGAFNNLSPSNTRGILITSDGTNNVALTVGSNTQVLVADSTQANGIKWGTNSPTIGAQGTMAVIATTGTYTTQSNTSTSTIYWIECIAGGGGTGGSGASGAGGCSSGGGAGAYAEGYLTNIAASTAISVTIGTAGQGGTGNAAGGTGGSTGLSAYGLLLTGGAFTGGYNSGVPNYAAAGGSASVIPAGFKGQNGGPGGACAKALTGGMGASTRWGGGGTGGVTGINGAPGSAGGAGSGGGGCVDQNCNGGAGAAGLCIIRQVTP